MLEIDLSGGFDRLWSNVSGGMSVDSARTMSMIGAALVLWSIGRWVWARSRGRQERASGVAWTLLVGVALAAPGMLLPLLFNAIDVAVNLVLAAVAGN